ncbi:hypothetical protein BDW02DRAFT_347738 [Decorospora gaudefroyi]|uniref:Uncharacterized protein n=1 Tax=Decorospora gaudefroyi TaxID=184978 RepID=A0A6A5KFU4_9PLEO|nr:hypothetical protein BDW02DRAFT_347738 [Decorospora gaudefroyi]
MAKLNAHTISPSLATSLPLSLPRTDISHTTLLHYIKTTIAKTFGGGGMVQNARHDVYSRLYVPYSPYCLVYLECVVKKSVSSVLFCPLSDGSFITMLLNRIHGYANVFRCRIMSISKNVSCLSLPDGPTRSYFGSARFRSCTPP